MRARRQLRTWGRVGVLAVAVGAFLVPASPAHAAGTLTSDRATADFGEQRVGTNGDVERIVVTANGQAVTITDVVVTGGNALLDFLASAEPNQPDPYCYDITDDDEDQDVTLQAGESCLVDLVFLPTDRGQRSGVLSFESDATSAPTTTLFGTGTVGYYVAGPEGEVTSFGDAVDFGDMSGAPLNEPIIDMAAYAWTGDGYWLLGLDGGVFSFGDSQFFGSMGGIQLNQPIVGIASTPTGDGYWLVALDGGVFAFGDAGFFGSMGGQPLNQPIVGIASTPTGNGYWLVALDGGVFAFGDAEFYGSMGGHPLNEPVVGMASSPTGGGYHQVATDGGMFQFGDADFYGSMGGSPLNEPMIGMAVYPTGNGYWTVALDGGVFAFGDAPFMGSLGGTGAEAVSIEGTAPVPPAAFFGLTAADADDGRVSLSSRKLPADRKR